LARWWPGAWGRGRSTAGILAAGLVLRLLFVWAWPADSDVNRYIVEGALQGTGGNPYLTAPGEPGLAERLPEAARSALPGVNHKELAAAYPPLAELYCRLVAAISPTPLGFKVAAGLADLAGCAVMALVLAGRGLPASLLLLWAANPLALGMAAGEGHLDALVGLGVALGLLGFARGRDGLGFLCLAAAGMVKYPALVLIPFFLQGKNAGRVWTALVPLTLFGLYAEAGGKLFASIAVFAGYLSHGGPVVSLLRPVCGRGAPAVSLGLGACVLAGLWLTVQDQRRGPPAAMAVVLACLPSTYPWYFLALVPLWLVRPDRSVWWLLAGQGLATAPAWLRPAGLGGEGLALAAAWLPWAGWVVLGWYRPRTSGPGPLFGPVAGLSVVVPARNEAARLGACLSPLAKAVAAGEVLSVVVADGGSTDDTVAVARANGARVVTATGGRGGQIAAGVALGGGEAVLVLHADAVCDADVPGRIVRALNDHPSLAGGAVGMAFSDQGPGFCLVAGLNALRARMTGISFGDQGQFFRRQALHGRGGFPDLALMEDVELALRLREAGETALLGGGLSVSGRRWAGSGFGAKVGRVLRLFAGYLVARRLGRADPTGRQYYQSYYGRPPHQTGV
jgi:hypothetical protein